MKIIPGIFRKGHPMPNCPQCNAPYDPVAQVCNQCGNQFGDDFIFHPVCPKCGKLFEPGADICDEDGTPLISTGQIRRTGVRLSNREIMADARRSLKGKWGLAIGTCVIYWLIFIAVNAIPVAGTFISILISGAMSVGLCLFALAIARRKEAHLALIFEGFKKFSVSLGAYLLSNIFIFLWALLFLIPGIIASLRYAMIFFIIAEDDRIGPLEAITKSKEMMLGHKWKLFCLYWRFFGWALLCLLTLGIGFLWFVPYVVISFARFYEEIA